MPTATDDALGSGKWQLGVAAVAVSNITPTCLAGALVTWQSSVGPVVLNAFLEPQWTDTTASASRHFCCLPD